MVSCTYLLHCLVKSAKLHISSALPSLSRIDALIFEINGFKTRIEELEGTVNSYLIDKPAKDDGPPIHIDESTRAFQSAHETVNRTVLEAEQDINQESNDSFSSNHLSPPHQ